MKKVLLALLGTGILSAIAVPTKAAILSVGGGGQMIPAPDSVVDDFPGYEDSEFMLGFNEIQNFVLTRDIQVDGINDNVWIEKGTKVSSHMIFMNNPGFPVLENIASWTFDGTILGVMSDVDGELEAASNDILGNPGTLYPGSFSNRGLEPNDFYTGIGTNTLDVSMRVTEPGDWIRVVTVSSVPEPASIFGLLAMAVLGGSSILKHQKH